MGCLKGVRMVWCGLWDGMEWQGIGEDRVYMFANGGEEEERECVEVDKDDIDERRASAAFFADN